MQRITADRRQINDARSHIFGGGEERMIAFVCECDAGCLRAVPLTVAAFLDLRRQGKPILFAAHIPDEEAPLAADPSDAGVPAEPNADTALR